MKVEQKLSKQLSLRRREGDSLREATNRMKLNKSVFNTKKEFRLLFNEFMAPRGESLLPSHQLNVPKPQQQQSIS